MNSTELKLEYNVCEKPEYGIPAIIVAAGVSSRMQGIDKQFMSLVGIPTVARTLIAFENSPAISKIIVVTAAGSIPYMQLVCDKYMITKLTDIVGGGSTRHESVMRGIKRLDSADKKVLIHDGARPFVDNKIICDVAQALETYDAALCVRKINDTVKSVNEKGEVVATVDRTTLYSAQTPQGVLVEKYLSACESLENTEKFTDDASIMEAAGFTVKTVEGSSRNIKITTPDDILIAEAIISQSV